MLRKRLMRTGPEGAAASGCARVSRVFAPAGCSFLRPNAGRARSCLIVAGPSFPAPPGIRVPFLLSALRFKLLEHPLLDFELRLRHQLVDLPGLRELGEVVDAEVLQELLRRPVQE